MSWFNHFAPVKYESVNFNTLNIGDKFRMGVFKGKIRRYLIMKKTGELTYVVMKSGEEKKLFNNDLTVYKYEQ